MTFKCPGCGKSYKVGEDLAGKRVKCKCGHTMKLPSVPTKPDAVDGSDPMGSLLDDELPPAQSAMPSMGPIRRAPREAAPAKVKKKRRKKRGGDPSPMANALMGVGIIVGLALVVGVIALLLMRSFRPGFPTPEETFAAHQEALEKKNWRSLIRTYSAESQGLLVCNMLMLASMTESNPSMKAVLVKHGVNEMIASRDVDEMADESADGLDELPEGDPNGTAPDGEEEMSEEEEDETNSQDYKARIREDKERCDKAASAVGDKVAFFVDFMAAIEAERDRRLPRNPVLKVLSKKPEGEARRALAAGKLSNLKIDGDTAQGEMSFTLPGEDQEVASVLFKKSDKRWFMHLPSAEDSSGSPMRNALDGRAVLGF